MASNAKFATIASLAGDPARAAMLHALMDGRALTASELARAGGITPQTASGHLAQLSEGGLISVLKQGPHRYHRLASPTVADMMESIMRVASDLDTSKAPLFTGPKDKALRAGRTCYDHLAGTLGVAIADTLVEGGHAELSDEPGLITKSGSAALSNLGIDVKALAAPAAKPTTKAFCRPCLDWSERRPHLAGKIGAAICAKSFENDWIRRVQGSRAVALTTKGRRLFRDTLGVLNF
jgi:DNA-binding transcriptional ArsR family regulator